MNLALLLMAAALCALYSVATKFIPTGNLRLNMLVVTAFSLPTFLIYLVMTILEGGAVSPITLLCGFLWGSVSVITEITYFLAMQSGPLSYTSFIFSASMIIPTLGSAIIWQETISVLQWVGIVLFLIAFYFICVPGSEKGVVIKKSWIPLCLAAFFSNGPLALFIKAQQNELQGAEASAVMMVAFASAMVVSFAAFVFSAPLMKEKLFTPVALAGMKKALWPIAGVALSNGVSNGIVTYLSSRVAGAWLYPCVLGGSMIIVTLFSALCLREKVNRWGWLGLGIGLAAMIASNI